MYQKTFLLTKPAMTDILITNTHNLVEPITRTAKSGGSVNIFLILHHYATDVISQFTYGPHGSTKTLVDAKYRNVAEQSYRS